ncbi:replication protein [Streptococcus pneumoniae]|uniref:conserved phage C-terminal domain-containing protein n=1 Tax=Streptococcus pneumoniae TaxID=1313 RepID=UPI0007654C10|nr:conserved phage C-terminal domain-containing protein [Streptococcus pneumoniae]CVO26808.1 replication protein [Streptococcus pneumoniae]CVP22669.1 replication protein [Streptococcus pneumoniae]CVU58528.1 replication protein [Streptococcus pneumoniae]CVW37020.1 replication protein [Streptococcus pneumoniae]CVW71667.1 replication protein [Streptococcus pneumoniae]
MAKTKIYFWLKVDKKFFDNLFIKRLKNMPGGYTMTVIYIRLMLESLEDDCILYYEGYFDSLVQELALKLDVSEDDINMTLAYFTKCGLIQIDDDGHATLSQAKAMVESETNWAKYKREQRKQAQNMARLESVQDSGTDSNSCPTEIEIENRVNSKSNNLYLDNILSGNPDLTFPTWLEETAIKDLERTKHKELWVPIAYLNQVANKRYKFVDKTKRLLLARVKEGYTLEDFKQVIDIKTAEWKDSPEFSKYLRPETLFGSKFDGYLNQKPKTIKGESEDNFPDLPF